MQTIFKKFLLLAAMACLTPSMHGSAIHRAVVKGNVEKVEKILKKHPGRLEQKIGFAASEWTLGFGVSHVDPGDTPLMAALRARKPDLSMINFLLERGASAKNIRIFYLGRTPSVAILLVKYGAPVSHEDLRQAICSSGNPSLDRSVVRGWTRFALLLIDRGVGILAGGKYSPLRTLFPVGKAQGWNVSIMQAMLVDILPALKDGDSR